MNFGHLRPPLAPKAAARQIPVAGGSIKRAALERLLAAWPAGGPELVPAGVIASLGIEVAVVEIAGPVHVQASSWLEHASRHLHNARAIAGGAGRTSGRTWARLPSAPILWAVRVGRTIAHARRDGASVAECGRLLAPVGWLYGAKALGEWLGVLVGPGDSATRLE